MTLIAGTFARQRPPCETGERRRGEKVGASIAVDPMPAAVKYASQLAVGVISPANFMPMPSPNYLADVDNMTAS